MHELYGALLIVWLAEETSTWSRADALIGLQIWRNQPKDTETCQNVNIFFSSDNGT